MGKQNLPVKEAYFIGIEKIFKPEGLGTVKNIVHICMSPVNGVLYKIFKD